MLILRSVAVLFLLICALQANAQLRGLPYYNELFEKDQHWSFALKSAWEANSPENINPDDAGGTLIGLRIRRSVHPKLAFSVIVGRTFSRLKTNHFGGYADIFIDLEGNFHLSSTWGVAYNSRIQNAGEEDKSSSSQLSGGVTLDWRPIEDRSPFMLFLSPRYLYTTSSLNGSHKSQHGLAVSLGLGILLAKVGFTIGMDIIQLQRASIVNTSLPQGNAIGLGISTYIAFR